MLSRGFYFFLVAQIGLSACSVAQACTPAVSTVVVFAEGSATLDHDQIALIATRLDHFRRLYPHANAVDIEGVARSTAPGAKQLAQRRAAEVANAVRTLFDGVELHVFSNVYSPKWSTHDGNYAAFDVVPSTEDTSPCASVQVPGFKR